MAKQIAKSFDVLTGQALTRWTFRRRDAAIIASFLALASEVGYNWTHRDYNSGGTQRSPLDVPRLSGEGHSVETIGKVIELPVDPLSR